MYIFSIIFLLFLDEKTNYELSSHKCHKTSQKFIIFPFYNIALLLIYISFHLQFKLSLLLEHLIKSTRKTT